MSKQITLRIPSIMQSLQARNSRGQLKSKCSFSAQNIEERGDRNEEIDSWNNLES